MKKVFLIATVLFFAHACKKEKYPLPAAPEPINTPLYTLLPMKRFGADTMPQKRNLVIEHMSGVLCWWTPQGHDYSAAIANAHPGQVFQVANHAGDFSGPRAGYPNFIVPISKYLWDLAGHTPIPAAMINRMTATDLAVPSWYAGTPMAIARQNWAKASETALSLNAPVNLDVRAWYDPSTHMLYVDVEMYFTENVPLSAASTLHVYLLQDKLMGKQKIINTGDSLNYVHNNVLRDKLTAKNEGETLTETTVKGSRLKRSYTYKVPEFYNGTTPDGGGAVLIENLKVLAFVAQGQINILNASETSLK